MFYIIITMEKEVNEQQTETTQETVNEQTNNQESAQETQEDLNSAYELLDSKFNELNDKYVRLYSEFENFRRRTAKEKIDLINNASERIIKDLLPVLDDFERGIESNKKVTDVDALKKGFELVHNKFLNLLLANGLKPMNSVGKEFNIDEHEAITKTPVSNKKDKDKVVDELEKGYLLNDKVIRFAKVVIGE